jgi:dihydrofolate reductase
MRRIIASTYTTLDGFIDDPHEWALPYNDEGAQQYAMDVALGADALLLGRVTFQGMAQAWPHMGGNPYADHINAIDKYVVAGQSVQTQGWGPTTVIPGSDLLAQVNKLKRTPGADILIWGNGRLTDALATGGLLDEYRLWLYPVIKGSGQPLFRPGSRTGMTHLDTTWFESGLVVLSYRVSAG